MQEHRASEYAYTATTSAPYPRSHVIKGIKWAPASSIIRKAEGNDNWPIAWGGDGRTVHLVFFGQRLLLGSPRYIVDLPVTRNVDTEKIVTCLLSFFVAALFHPQLGKFFDEAFGS